MPFALKYTGLHDLSVGIIIIICLKKKGAQYTPPTTGKVKELENHSNKNSAIRELTLVVKARENWWADQSCNYPDPELGL